MKSILPSFGVTRRVLLSTLAVLPAFRPQNTMAQPAAPTTSSGFSFAACGDTRPMMYLPDKAGQRDPPGMAGDHSVSDRANPHLGLAILARGRE